MTTQLTQFAADQSSGLGALGVDGKAFIIQLITFVLAFFVLKRYAFGPINKMLDDRRKVIEDGVNIGEQMQKDQVALEAQVEAALHAARQKADGIISAAQDTSRLTVREAEDKAREKTAGILSEADERIKQDTARARKALEKELVGLISDATEAIIDEKVDAKKDAKLIERALKTQEKTQAA